MKKITCLYSKEYVNETNYTSSMDCDEDKIILLIPDLKNAAQKIKDQYFSEYHEIINDEILEELTDFFKNPNSLNEEIFIAKELMGYCYEDYTLKLKIEDV